MVLAALGLGPRTAVAAGTWIWPVTGPVIAAFDPPASPYGAGHRGIDIAAPLGTPVLATAAGVVTFAGTVGGGLFVTVDHGGGLESRYSFLGVVLVEAGDAVLAGTVLGRSGAGHVGGPVPHLHLGVVLDDVYVDPLGYLVPLSVTPFLRLAPLRP
jgi:murein DD-endopeptidase MepM/ murein hydrolase activator NlpD